MSKEYDNTNKGALWLRTSQKGLKYMSGTLNVEGTEYDIAMFKNDKQSDKAPDYRITVKDKRQLGQAITQEKEEEFDTSVNMEDVDYTDLLPF